VALGRVLVFSGAVIVVLSCTRAPSGQTPVPAPAPGSASAAAPEQVTRVPGRRPPLSRDSLAKLRTLRVQEVLKSIAGRENEPAERVFKNVQVLKGLTARQLLTRMDQDFGVALSWQCSNCHRVNINDYATDTLKEKKRARAMILMTNRINKEDIPALYPKDPPQVACMTCHRGYNEPLDSTFLIPPRGAPGGPPRTP
jgi:hypothetical protein